MMSLASCIFTACVESVVLPEMPTFDGAQTAFIVTESTNAQSPVFAETLPTAALSVTLRDGEGVFVLEHGCSLDLLGTDVGWQDMSGGAPLPIPTLLGGFALEEGRRGWKRIEDSRLDAFSALRLNGEACRKTTGDMEVASLELDVSSSVDTITSVLASPGERLRAESTDRMWALENNARPTPLDAYRASFVDAEERLWAIGDDGIFQGTSFEHLDKVAALPFPINHLTHAALSGSPDGSVLCVLVAFEHDSTRDSEVGFFALETSTQKQSSFELERIDPVYLKSEWSGTRLAWAGPAGCASIGPFGEGGTGQVRGVTVGGEPWRVSMSGSKSLSGVAYLARVGLLITSREPGQLFLLRAGQSEPERLDDGDFGKIVGTVSVDESFFIAVERGDQVGVRKIVPGWPACADERFVRDRVTHFAPIPHGFVAIGDVNPSGKRKVSVVRSAKRSCLQGR